MTFCECYIKYPRHPGRGGGKGMSETYSGKMKVEMRKPGWDEGFRAGVEAMRDAANKHLAERYADIVTTHAWMKMPDVNDIAARLLAETDKR